MFCDVVSKFEQVKSGASLRAPARLSTPSNGLAIRMIFIIRFDSSPVNSRVRFLMERVQITVVEDAFPLAGRGIIGTGIWLDEAQEIPNNALVEVVCPGGTTFRTSLGGVTLFTKCFSEKRVIGLLFGSLSDKSQIPLGSEVWLVESLDNSLDRT
jgi:hypothetical protein